MQLLTQLLTALNCSLHAPAPLMQLRMQLLTQLITHASAPLMQLHMQLLDPGIHRLLGHGGSLAETGDPGGYQRYLGASRKRGCNCTSGPCTKSVAQWAAGCADSTSGESGCGLRKEKPFLARARRCAQPDSGEPDCTAGSRVDTLTGTCT